MRSPAEEIKPAGLKAVIAIAAVMAITILPLQAGELKVLLEAKGTDPPQTAWLEVTPSGPEETEKRLEVVLDSSHGDAVIEVDLDQSVQLKAGAEGFWSPQVEVQEFDQQTLQLDLWPAASIRAAVQFPRGSDPADEMTFRLLKTPETAVGSQPQSAAVNCPISEESRIHCTIPAGVWHFRAQTESFIPRYFWDLEFGKGKAVELKGLDLQRGGSIVGSVVTEDGAVLPQGGMIEVGAFIDRSGMTPARSRELELQWTVSSLNESGFFQIVGLAEGDYELTARVEGYTPTTMAPVSVQAQTELELSEALLLVRPLRLEILVDPATDIYGEPFKVRMGRQTGAHQAEMVAQSALLVGGWVPPPTPPGRYSIYLLDSRGSSMVWEDFDLQPGNETLWIELDMTLVIGTVYLGDDELEAQLTFGGRNGGESIQVESDAEGRFEVVLPRAGDWGVDIHSEDPAVTVIRHEVSVDPEPNSREAEVTIELPDTSVEGQVVDRDGAAVAQARVTLLGTEGFSMRLSGQHGHFEFRGLDSGEYTLAATQGDRRSPAVSVYLAEGSIPGSVRLVVAAQRRFTGVVVSEGDPIFGARVLAAPVTARGTLAALMLREQTTGVNGSFSSDLPSDTRWVHLTVTAPGFVHYRTRLSADFDGPVEVQLDRTGGGTLSLRKSSKEPVGWEHPRSVIYANGGVLIWDELERWSRMNRAPRLQEGRLVVPAMPSGNYAFCKMTIEEMMMVLSEAALPKASSCSEGYLSPGGELILELPTGE
jgi:hypothetical protein